MAEVTTFWIDFEVADLEAILPDGIVRGKLVIDSAFATNDGKTLTVEFCKPD